MFETGSVGLVETQLFFYALSRLEVYQFPLNNHTDVFVLKNKAMKRCLGNKKKYITDRKWEFRFY